MSSRREFLTAATPPSTSRPADSMWQSIGSFSGTQKSRAPIQRLVRRYIIYRLTFVSIYIELLSPDRPFHIFHLDETHFHLRLLEIR